MSESNQYKEENINNHQLSGTSPNFRTDLAKKLEELVPEAIADGKVDVVKLKELLAEDAGEPNERFGLFWPGKKQALRAAQEPTTATLKPAKDESKYWDTTNNIFIEGDNLEVLKVLQKQYHNSIKMIYIDPPYNTGKDFVYPDNFKEGLQNYLEFSQQVDEGNKKISTNTETAGRYHSNWLNMMYPRLKLARNLLTGDGVIMVSINDHEVDNLRKIMSEIFGENNFIAQFVWNTKKAAQGMTTANMIVDNHEYVVVFARNSTRFKFLGIQRSSEGFSNPDNDERGLWKRQQMQRLGQGLPTRKVVDPRNGNIFEFETPYTQDKIDRWVSEKRILFPDSIDKFPVRKEFLNEYENNQQLITSIGLFATKATTQKLYSLFGGEKIFTNPKPDNLLKFLIESTMSEGIILDFFAGSGTVAHAVMQLNAEDGGNRKHIMVQLPEPTDEKSEAFKAGYKKISDIARERINRAGEKIKADFADKLAKRDTPLDVGYRTYKLADTNFTKWQGAPTGDLTELQARLDLMRESSNDDASEEDLLTEVLLKMGLPLTTRTQEREVAGLRVYQVVGDDNEATDVQPVLYMNEHIKPTLEQLRSIIADLTPSKFVILDDAFQGDNQLKTNLVQTCKSYDVELWTV